MADYKLNVEYKINERHQRGEDVSKMLRCICLSDGKIDNLKLNSSPFCKQYLLTQTHQIHRAIFSISNNLKDNFSGEVINDKVFISKMYGTKVLLILSKFGLVLGLLFLILQIYCSVEIAPDDMVLFFIFLPFNVLFIILPVFVLVCELSIPEERLILDRMNGLVTFSHRFSTKKSTIPFSDCLAFMIVKGGIRSRRIYVPEQFFLELRQGGNSYLKGREINFWKYRSPCVEYWSFIVWYMDKNRPLPPFKKFDPYRQSDFERRKAEGFPLPLYASFIDTPEANSQQQQERDAFWDNK